MLVACVVLVGIAGPALSVAHAAGDDPIVRVVEKDGLFRVSTTFVVAHAAGLVTAVLTDYEHIPEFMTDVKISRVLERSAGRAVVEQEAVAQLLFFSRRIYLELEIVETPGRIQFRDRGGRSFLRYEGEWRIDPDGAGARVSYELTAHPTSDVPAAIVRRLLGRDLQKMIAQLSSEMAKRESGASRQ